MKERKKFFKKLKKKKKNILATPGFEPTTLSGDNISYKTGTFMNGPLATTGKVSSVQLAQSAPF